MSETDNRGAEVVTADGRSLPLISATLRGQARGGIARLILEQRFENRHAETLRVTYRMPLPADGAVSGYAFTIAERVIRGQVDRKAAARERFEAAVAEGKTAALLEQERADIFTQEIGNLPAGESLVATITIDQRLVWLPEGEWELRFPTVIGPRYVTDPEDARATKVDVAVAGISARIQIEIAIGDAITAGRKATSPTHTVKLRDGIVELSEQARLDRDLVVRWPVASAQVGLALDVARPAEGGSYGLLTIVPPAREAKAAAVARDLIVLLDTSGSMGGPPLDIAKQVVGMIIESLGEGDRLELIEFSSSTRRYKPEPVAATAVEKRDAIRWVRSRSASGGTEMYSGIVDALQTLRIGAQRQVVVVTDGYVGGEAQIVKLLHGRLPGSCRLHVLGVGSAVNRSLAGSLARAGRGAEVLVGPDEDAERGAKRLLDRTRRPILTNVEIAGSAYLHHAPEHVPDVFEGAPIVAALALRPEGGELVVRGTLAHDTWEQRIAVPARGAGEGNQAVVALYGREHVADLEMRAVFDGRGTPTGSPAEGRGGSIAEAVDHEIEDTGLKFQIATRLTSWLAIDDARRTVGPSRHDSVPQELPYGTTAASFGLRSTSGADLKLASFHAASMPMPMRGRPSAGYAPSAISKTMMVAPAEKQASPQSGSGPKSNRPQQMSSVSRPEPVMPDEKTSRERLVLPVQRKVSWAWLVALVLAIIIALTWWLAS